jgi:DNA polymerase-3 subunit epsilon
MYELRLVDGKVDFVLSSEIRENVIRDGKGKSLLKLFDNFVVLDFETTGLDPIYDEIIEVGAIRVSNGIIDSEFSTLVKPDGKISSFVTDLTGITNKMVTDAPKIQDVLPSLLKFIGDSVVLGHNVHFDINFLYDNCKEHLGISFTNDMLCTMRIARNAFKDIKFFKLSRLAHYFNVPAGTHRALADCHCALGIYNAMLAHFAVNNIDFDALIKQNKSGTIAKNISTDKTEFDESHPLFGCVCVFTGTLEKMSRKDAMQIVVDLGGKCADNVTKKTNYLVLGVTDYKKISGEKSNKQIKAEQFQLAGLDIEVISENVFYEMIFAE